jgi:hypothetical protein
MNLGSSTLMGMWRQLLTLVIWCYTDGLLRSLNLLLSHTFQ